MMQFVFASIFCCSHIMDVLRGGLVKCFIVDNYTRDSGSIKTRAILVEVLDLAKEGVFKALLGEP